MSRSAQLTFFSLLAHLSSNSLSVIIPCLFSVSVFLYSFTAARFICSVAKSCTNSFFTLKKFITNTPRKTHKAPTAIKKSTFDQLLKIALRSSLIAFSTSFFPSFIVSKKDFFAEIKSCSIALMFFIVFILISSAVVSIFFSSVSFVLFTLLFSSL